MKAIISNISTVNQVINIEYPILMINMVNQIVLFTAPSTGTLLVDLDRPNHVIGSPVINWPMNGFKPYDKSVTIVNQ